jgi:flagellar FliJ protein
MKAFNFRLEPVLKLREFAEKEARLALGRAVSELNAIEVQIDANAAGSQAAACGRFSQANSTTDIVRYENYINRLGDDRRRLLASAARAAQVVEEKRRLYNEASAERKSFSEVRKIQPAEYQRAANLEEEKTIDEMAGSAAGRLSQG